MMHSGRKVFDYPKGTYTPIISDGQDLYLTGYSSITALAPIHPIEPKVGESFVAPAPARAARAARAAKLTPARRRAIRLRRRRAAAAAGAARQARKRGSPRSGGGR